MREKRVKLDVDDLFSGRLYSVWLRIGRLMQKYGKDSVLEVSPDTVSSFEESGSRDGREFPVVLVELVHHRKG